LSNDSSQNKSGLWDWVKAISTLIVVGVFSYKVYITPIVLTVDFPTLLSLLLALFSVALAALFYFKATDTSNTF
jgi:amino acid transporter